MTAFILKITDYRVGYEMHIESPFEDYNNDSTFKEIPPKSLFYMKCLNELKELEVPITPQEYSDSKATSPTTSPRWPFTSYTPRPPIIHDSFMLDDDYGCNYEPHKKLRSSTPII